MALIRLLFLAMALAAGAAQAQIAHRATTTSADIIHVGAGAAPAGDPASVTTCTNVETATPPAGEVGDLLLAFVNSREDSATIGAGTPAGWTQLYAVTFGGGQELQGYIYYRIATGTLTTDDGFSITQATSCNSIAAQISRFRNVDTANPFINVPIPGANDVLQNTDNVDTGTETTVAENSMLVVASFVNDNNGITQSAGWNISFETPLNVNRDLALNAHYQLAQAAGAQSASNWAMGATDENIGVIFSLRPAVRIKVPAGTLANDVMIANVAWTTNTTITAPAGWTQVIETNNGTATTSRIATYRRTADAADAAGAGTLAYEWRFLVAQTAGAAVGSISSYSGVDVLSADPVDVFAGQANASALAQDAPTLTPTVPNTMLVRGHELVSSGTWTTGAGTERADLMSQSVAGATGISMATYEEAWPTAVATGIRTATASGNADRGAANHIALRPAYVHYSVSYPDATTYPTCEPGRVRISAHHAGHGLAAPPNGTLMTIVTASGGGVWQAMGAGDTGTPANWTPSGLNDGTATYLWNGVEAYIDVRLRRNTAGNESFNVSDTNARTENSPTEDLTLTFADTVLRLTADGASSASIESGVPVTKGPIAGKRNDEGANTQTLYVQAVQTLPGTATCTTLFQGQNRDIDFAAVCNNPATCSAVAGTAFEVVDRTSALVSVAKNDNTPTPASYTTVSLAFSNDANAMAPLIFRYGDAGQMTLHMRYTLPAPPATTISGASNAFVVRPFGIAVRGANAGTAIAHASDHTSAVLAAAGDNFTMTLAAYKWAPGQDVAPLDGFPDFGIADVVDITGNGLTPNFAPVTTSMTPNTNIPGIATGVVSRGVNCASAGSVLAASWSGGAATVTDFCYSEAGNVHIVPFVATYIDAGVVVPGSNRYDGLSDANGRIGRFRPKHFAVSAATLANRAAAACAPASAFSYMDEGLTLGFTLTAQNAQNATTQNYTGAYAKLDVTSTANFVLGARSGATNLTARLDTGGTPAGSWSNGAAAMTIPSMVRRATPDAPDGPHAAVAFGIAPTDSDSVAMNTLDLDVDNNAAMDRKDIGVSGEARYGRLRVLNAIGSEKLALPVGVRVEHWSGTGFVTNTLDNCTTLDRDQISMSFTPASNLTACETAISAATVNFTAGVGSLTLDAPGAGNNGSVLLTPQLGTAAAGTYCPSVGGAAAASTFASRGYLFGRWNDASNPDANASTAYDDNPAGRAAFGMYGGQPSNYIYFRENH